VRLFAAQYNDLTQIERMPVKVTWLLSRFGTWRTCRCRLEVRCWAMNVQIGICRHGIQAAHVRAARCQHANDWRRYFRAAEGQPKYGSGIRCHGDAYSSAQ